MGFLEILLAIFLANIVLLFSKHPYAVAANVLHSDDACPNGTNYNEICRDVLNDLCGDDLWEDRCDKAQNLFCQNLMSSGSQSIFRCRCQENYKYNSNLDKCQGLVDSICNENVENDCVSSTECTFSEENPEEHRCSCKNGLVVDEETKECYSEHGNSCNSSWSDSPCGNEEYFFMKCLNGFCKCRNDFLYYDRQEKRCVPRFGQSCLEDEHSTLPLLCGTGMICSNNSGLATCQCNDTEIPDARGENCLPGVDMSCEVANCAHLLYCNETIKVCQCPSDYFIGGLRSESCSVRAGKNCSKDSECVKYAKCKNSKCTCDHGFYAGAFGECFVEYGEYNCDADANMCDDYGHMTCVHERFGPEIWGRCDCKDGYLYNSEIKKCQGSHFHDCNFIVDQDCASNLQCDEYNQCSCDTTTQYYDAKYDRCALLLGGDCKSEDIPCGYDATCSAAGKCECADSTLIPNRYDNECIIPSCDDSSASSFIPVGTTSVVVLTIVQLA